MCKSAEQCAERVADRENLVRELVDVLRLVYERFGPMRDEYVFSKRLAIDKVRAVLARAKEQQGE